MLLANAFSSGGENDLGLKFIIQDRPGTIEIGEKVGLLKKKKTQKTFPRPLNLLLLLLFSLSIQNWKDKCPEFLKNGIARFQGKS